MPMFILLLCTRIRMKDLENLRERQLGPPLNLSVDRRANTTMGRDPLRCVSLSDTAYVTHGKR
jgi:hypothetical protein